MTFRRISVPCIRCILTCVLPVMVLGGCGGGIDTAAVNGTVKVDGQPLEKGIIRFVPTDGTTGPKRSIEIENGTFTANVDQGPIVGSNLIQIEAVVDPGFAPDDQKAAEEFAKSRKRLRVVRIPDRYNKRSELKEVISGDGPNELTFDLKSK